MSGQTAQDVATKRTSDNLAAHNDVLAKVHKEHATAMKWLEKLHVKEKKAQEKANAKVTKLEKAFKESQDQVDKNNKKIQKLQKDKQKVEGSVNARQTKAQSAVKKCEANLTKAQQKQQTAAAKQAGPKELWKLELAVDKAEQKLEAARLNLAQVPEMVRLEAMKIDNKCNELATKVNHQQAKNKDAHRAALFDRDMTIAKLQAEKKQAEVAVRQLEKRLGEHKGMVGQAQTDHNAASKPAEPEPEPEPEPKPEEHAPEPETEAEHPETPVSPTPQ